MSSFTVPNNLNQGGKVVTFTNYGGFTGAMGENNSVQMVVGGTTTFNLMDLEVGFSRKFSLGTIFYVNDSRGRKRGVDPVASPTLRVLKKDVPSFFIFKEKSNGKWKVKRQSSLAVNVPVLLTILIKE